VGKKQIPHQQSGQLYCRIARSVSEYRPNIDNITLFYYCIYKPSNIHQVFPRSARVVVATLFCSCPILRNGHIVLRESLPTSDQISRMEPPGSSPMISDRPYTSIVSVYPCAVTAFWMPSLAGLLSVRTITPEVERSLTYWIASPARIVSVFSTSCSHLSVVVAIVRLAMSLAATASPSVGSGASIISAHPS